MGGEPVFIAEDKRGIYHAGLASAANHLVTLVVQSSDLLVAGGSAGPGQDARPAARRGARERAGASAIWR